MAAQESSLEKLDKKYKESMMQDRYSSTDETVTYECRQKGYFVWNDVPLCYMHDHEKLDQLDDFQFGDGDVLVSSFPKTGSHFVIDVISDILIAAGKKAEDTQIYSLEIGKIVVERQNASPKVVATHLPWRLLPRQAREGKVKIVRMSRNPKDMVCSWYPYALNKVENLQPGTTMDQFIDLWINGKIMYGNYLDWLKGWYPHLKDHNVFATQYEDMKTDLRSNVLKLSAYLNVTLTKDQIAIIVEKNTYANRVKVDKSGFDKFFFRRGEVGSWKNELTEEQIAKLDDWISKSMEGFEGSDLKFQF